MKTHPAALLLPPMTDDEYAGLKADVAEHGQRQPIIVHLGTVLDGRHRMKACEELGIEPNVEQFTGGDPIAYVLSSNVHRRSLSASQRAAVAVEAEALFAEQAAKRKGGRPRKDAKPGADRHPVDGKALAQAAKATGSASRTAARAKAVKTADPEKFEAIKRGEVSVDRAAKDVAAKKTADVEAEMERIVRRDPEVAADIDRHRLHAKYAKAVVGVSTLLTLDADAVAQVLDPMDVRLLVGLAADLTRWSSRVAGGGLHIVKESAQ